MAERVAIVGGGIAGITAALELRRRGFTVDVFDPGPLPHPNAASTDITKMIRMDYGADEFYTELMEGAFWGGTVGTTTGTSPSTTRRGSSFLRASCFCREASSTTATCYCAAAATPSNIS
jgi:glycine/D-amino acid oxidase-like deaminating enzyme